MAEQAARNYTVSKAFDRRYTKLYGLCGPIDANQPDSVAYNSHRTDCVSLFGRETTERHKHIQVHKRRVSLKSKPLSYRAEKRAMTFINAILSSSSSSSNSSSNSSSSSSSSGGGGNGSSSNSSSSSSSSSNSNSNSSSNSNNNSNNSNHSSNSNNNSNNSNHSSNSNNSSSGNSSNSNSSSIIIIPAYT
ncbi:hypothetical protein HZH66_006217 [Vespula vulgaris]|uniref:Uncharacterized protein n=1 Tax=Vespula vulgaris TaxID=7454 RepID=A0A834K6B4_VESVU|nr:hypothetical protein HZH66_006217 [Vespula vulgaris]